jgi:hypothetical protein
VQCPGLEDLKMKEGRPIRFDVWVAGEPPPLIEWFRNDQRLSNDDFTSISVYAKNSSVYSLKNAVLSIPKVRLSDYNVIIQFNLIYIDFSGC